MGPSHPRVKGSVGKAVKTEWKFGHTIWTVVESVVDPAEMRAAAEQMVRILVALRDNLNSEDGINAEAHGRIPFGENNPSGQVYELRLQAQEALNRAQSNLVTQAGTMKKLIDSIFVAVAEYEQIDIATDEQMKRLTGQLSEIQGEATSEHD
jgi:HD-like signal output (HDOD) protein